MSDSLKPKDALPGIYGPDGRPTFFADPAMDRFASVVLNMAQEMWVQDARISALEAAAGGSPPDEAEREAKALAFVHRIFAPLREPK